MVPGPVPARMRRWRNPSSSPLVCRSHSGGACPLHIGSLELCPCLHVGGRVLFVELTLYRKHPTMKNPRETYPQSRLGALCCRLSVSHVHHGCFRAHPCPRNGSSSIFLLAPLQHAWFMHLLAHMHVRSQGRALVSLCRILATPPHHKGKADFSRADPNRTECQTESFSLCRNRHDSSLLGQSRGHCWKPHSCKGSQSVG